MKKFLTMNGFAVLLAFLFTGVVLYHIITGIAMQEFPLWKFYTVAYSAVVVVALVTIYTFKQYHIAYLVENQRLKHELRESEKKYSAMTKIFRDKIDYYATKCQRLERDVRDPAA